MRKTLILTTIILMSLILFQKTSKANGVFEFSAISNIRIHFHDSNWDYKLMSLISADSDDHIFADLTINGVSFDSCGIRYKGKSSFNSTIAENPLYIKLNYTKDQKHNGYYTLKFPNKYIDSSLENKVLAFEITRKNMPPSHTGFANIYVENGLFLIQINKLINKKLIKTKQI